MPEHHRRRARPRWAQRLEHPPQPDLSAFGERCEESPWWLGGSRAPRLRLPGVAWVEIAQPADGCRQRFVAELVTEKLRDVVAHRRKRVHPSDYIGSGIRQLDSRLRQVLLYSQ